MKIRTGHWRPAIL